MFCYWGKLWNYIHVYKNTPGEIGRSGIPIMFYLKLNLLDMHINTNALKKRLHFITRRSLNPSLISFTNFKLYILRCILKVILTLMNIPESVGDSLRFPRWRQFRLLGCIVWLLSSSQRLTIISKRYVIVNQHQQWALFAWPQKRLTALQKHFNNNKK